MDPLVSVIVPVYNVFPYIREALDSVIDQTYSNLEIILIDDGSTDGSGKICDEYASRDSRIRVIHQEKKGLSAARNAGLDIMTGDLVAFLDSDDAFQNNFIEKTLLTLIRENVDIVLCKYTVHQTTKQMSSSSLKHKMPVIDSGVYNTKETLSALIDGKINVSVWNKLYRKIVWDSVRFAEGHVCEDYEVTYIISSQIDKVCVLSDSLYFHRKRQGSIAMVISQNNINDAFLAYNRTEEFIGRNIPELFTHDQLSAYRQNKLKRMLSCYYNTKKITDGSKHDYRTMIRQKIIDAGERYDINSFRFRDRTAYNMICKCPWLFDFCYPCYMILRRASYRMFGR